VSSFSPITSTRPDEGDARVHHQGLVSAERGAALETASKTDVMILSRTP